MENLFDAGRWAQALETDLGQGIAIGVASATLAVAALTILLDAVAPTIGRGWRIGISITFTGLVGTAIGGVIYLGTFGQDLEQGALPTVLSAVSVEPQTICAGDSVTVSWDFPSECAAGNCLPRGLADGDRGFECASTEDCGVGGECAAGRCRYPDPATCPAGQCSSLSTVSATFGDSVLVEDDRTVMGSVTFRPSESGQVNATGGRFFAGRGSTTMMAAPPVRLLNPNEQANFGGTLRFQCDGAVTHPYVLITDDDGISESTELRELRNTTLVDLEFILPNGDLITLASGEEVALSPPIPFADSNRVRAREVTPGISYADECERQDSAETSLPPGTVYVAPEPFGLGYGVGCSL